MEAKLWRLEFIPQAIGRHLRLFGRFAIQDVSLATALRVTWRGTRLETSNEATTVTSYSDD